MKNTKTVSKTFNLVEKVSKSGNVYYAIETEQKALNFKALYELGKEVGFWTKPLFVAELKKRAICIGNAKEGTYTQKDFTQVIADTLTFEAWEPKETKKPAKNKFSAKKTAKNDIAAALGIDLKQLEKLQKAMQLLQSQGIEL